MITVYHESFVAKKPSRSVHHTDLHEKFLRTPIITKKLACEPHAKSCEMYRGLLKAAFMVFVCTDNGELLMNQTILTTGISLACQTDISVQDIYCLQ